MPELPEVHTTATELNKLITGLVICDVWTDYDSPLYEGKRQIKNSTYFKQFKKDIVGAKVKNVSRRAKNVLINLSNGKTVLVHMKMTGHLLYGQYVRREENHESRIMNHGKWEKETWVPDEEANSLLWDPFNRFIHLVFEFSNKKHLVLSDMRKFAKVALFDTDKIKEFNDLKKIGPEPLETSFTFPRFKERLFRKPNGKIKQVLMDQEVIAGIGNIYSDEMLWRAQVHPLEQVARIPEEKLRKLYSAMKAVLTNGIHFKGDSDSDYRAPSGEKGAFQEQHRAYRKTGKPCPKRGCKGTIQRIKLGGRSAHFCDTHQRVRIIKE